jgi:antibiotic biosynthesis monooxygenase (ABM) superfamily enzyme
VPGTEAAIVIQTCIQADQDAAFAQWQREMGLALAKTQGFVSVTTTPPQPPNRVDWVTVQRFWSVAAATDWLNSDARLALMTGILDNLIDRYDLQLITDIPAGALPAPASMVISTRVKAGQEAAYRAWEHEIARVHLHSPGFKGYRFEPPLPGVQDHWLATIRFDSTDNLDLWMHAPERQRLLAVAAAFTDRIDTLVVRSGFDQWFPTERRGQSARPIWKQNMITLLMLFPIVFIFGLLVPTPFLMKDLGMTGPLAQFSGNLVAVICLNRVVPWISRRFGWWLQPHVRSIRTDALGAIALVGLYVALVVGFSIY